MALGEAPEEFDRLYEELLAPYEPAHPLLTSEIKTLAKLYWDYERWERARDGLLRREMELLDLDQLKMKQALERQTFDASQHEVFSQGLRRATTAPPSSSKFSPTWGNSSTWWKGANSLRITKCSSGRFTGRARLGVGAE